MNRMCREIEPMCETSEPSEKLFSREEMLPISLDIGRRILEIFGYQSISSIVFRLRSTRREIDDVINGDKMPNAELLLGIRKATGASIDWILTGEGSRYVTTTNLHVADKRPEQTLALTVIAPTHEAGITAISRPAVAVSADHSRPTKSRSLTL